MYMVSQAYAVRIFLKVSDHNDTVEGEWTAHSDTVTVRVLLKVSGQGPRCHRHTGHCDR